MIPDLFTNIAPAVQMLGVASLMQQPWAVHVPSLMELYISGGIRAREQVKAEMVQAQQSNHPNDMRVYEDVGVAVQPVRGVIYPGVSRMDEAWDGLFNTDRIHAATAAVAAMPGIKTLVFQMDTPGGSVFGLDPAAKAIVNLQRQRKDLSCVAFVGRLCASAGMYLAAACNDGIHATPGAVVGSIGTISSLTDTSGLWEKLGMKKMMFTADSSLKGLGTGGVAPTAEHIAHMEAMTAAYSKEFKGWMKKQRNLSPADMQGQIFEARKAPAGMVDSAVFTSVEQMLAAGLKI